MILLEYVKRIPGHRNSKGEPAPWTIVSHKTGKILSSHKTKKDAEEHLKQMHVFEEGIEMEKKYKGPTVTVYDGSSDMSVTFKLDDLADADWKTRSKKNVGSEISAEVKDVDERYTTFIFSDKGGSEFIAVCIEPGRWIVGKRVELDDPDFGDIHNASELRKRLGLEYEGNEIANKVADLDKFEDVLVDMESEFRRLKNDLHARYDKKPMDDSARKPLREFEKKMGELFGAWREFRFAEKFIRNK